MIPRSIYYCWFGNSPLPDLVLKCIDSWKKYCPEYEIHQIDESNFDIDECDYVREAYQKGRWAFVSDYARTKVLLANGGLYFDTDVELLKPIDDIVKGGTFFACETYYQFSKDSLTPFSGTTNHGVTMVVNPGLVMGAEPGDQTLNTLLDSYLASHYVLPNGVENQETIVNRITGILKQAGFDEDKDAIQTVSGATIYPPEYFAGFNNTIGVMQVTSNTRSVHHYAASWFSSIGHAKNKIRRKFIAKGKAVYCVGYLLTAPLAVLDCVARRLGTV